MVTDIPTVIMFRKGEYPNTDQDLFADANDCEYTVSIVSNPVTPDIVTNQGTFPIPNPEYVKIRSMSDHATFTVQASIGVGTYDLTITYTNSAFSPD